MKGKIIGIASLIAALALAAFIFFKFYFVFGEGVKAGELNFVVYKGYVFKTYEGRAIQAGFGKGKGTNAAALQSYEFDFSITDKAIAAISGFVRLGIPMMNQCVLLRGVNDTVSDQVELANKLMYNRIKPYYLFQGDLVKGTAHLRVPLSKGLELEKEMRKQLSGLSMPQYTIDLPNGGGKVILTENHIVSGNGSRWIFSTPEGEERIYPEDI